MDIFDEFKTKTSEEPPVSSTGTDIFDEFKSNRQAAPITEPTPQPKEQVRTGIGSLERFPGLLPGIAKGAVNVGNTLSLGANTITDTVDRLLKNPSRDLGERTQENIDRVNKLYKEKFGDLSGSGIGEVGGEIAASSALVPAGIIAHGMKTGFGALPTITGTGVQAVTKSAPLLNRLGAAVATGGVVGGGFGAVTSAGSDEPFAEHVGKNIIGGAVGGPVVEGGAALASRVSPFIRKVLSNIDTNARASMNGMSPWAVKNILIELENTGHTVQEARQVLQKLGPQATLADLDASLQKEVGGLAQRGGRPTSIVENRYSARAQTANDEAQKIMEIRLGIKPDVTIERGKILGTEAENIQNAAQRAVKSDYDIAHNSMQQLHVYSLIGDINKQLESAVGAKANALKEVKGYFYKTVKDAQGNPVQSIKNNVADLHEVRQGIDDIINKRGDSLPPNALRSVQKIRDAVDAELKTIPEMAAADTKYAEKMKLKEGLQIGYEALTFGNHQSFKKIFDNASSELQDTIRKGLRAAIGDKMQSAAKGELAGAQQLFKAKNDTREKLKTAFGTAGEDVLDALTKQATLRATEQMVASGSRTAINQRINAKYDNAPHAPGPFSEAVKGLGGDIIAGTPGGVAAIMGARRAGGNIANRMRQRRMDINAETSADLLSRSGPDLDNALNVLERVHSVQNKISGNPIKLPVVWTASSSVGEPIVEKGKEVGKGTGKIIKHQVNTLRNFVEGL